jgi:hypothetical protein
MIARMRLGLAAILILLVAACETPQTANPSAAPRLSKGTVILLPPPDVQLAELTASGIEEPHADWTETGRRNLLSALDAENTRRGVGFVKIEYSGLTAEDQAEVGQIEKLHQAVALSMLAHRHVPALRLPTKTSVYDWSMGPEVGLLRKANDGQGKYVLFVTVHDSFSSAGRVAMQVIMGALTGYVPHGGAQVGYASLVDLDTGKVAWFGSVAKGTGDVRDPTGAAETVSALLQGLPG